MEDKLRCNFPFLCLYAIEWAKKMHKIKQHDLEKDLLERAENARRNMRYSCKQVETPIMGIAISEKSYMTKEFYDETMEAIRTAEQKWRERE